MRIKGIALFSATVIGLTTTIGSIAQAQTNKWPEKPVTWVIPFTPGGITDTTSRLIGKKITEVIGQPIIIDNRPGGGGMVGTEYVSRAAPDGYTMIYGTQGTMAANLSLYPNVKYDPLTTFIPVHALLKTPNVLLVNAELPFKTVSELVEYAKTNPGKLNMASAGTGTGSHLAGELFQNEAGIKFTHVPFKGSAPALQNLAGAQVDIMFDYPVSSRPLIESGKVRALAVTDEQRVKTLPDVPTVVEAGYPTALSTSWSSIFVPAGTSDEIVETIRKGAEHALASDEVKEYAAQNGSAVLTGVSGQKFVDLINSEKKRWKDVIEKSGASAN
ncbi:Bug family tripartite tricarboxylate transporter substrate binding protein [Orrella sp. 11846]|uniref:Bug family tripartite tricarboxylate transporter substrate binding protein n=1 Tax=Orrella sp. 11846 TaxID=3409913 RepID=UPI003B59DF2C